MTLARRLQVLEQAIGPPPVPRASPEAVLAALRAMTAGTQLTVQQRQALSSWSGSDADLGPVLGQLSDGELETILSLRPAEK